MVFDFIRKRAEEGIQQVQNIATKTAVRLRHHFRRFRRPRPRPRPLSM